MRSLGTVLKKLTKKGNIGLIASVALLTVVMSLAYPNFLTLFNIEITAMGFIQEALMALGMTLVIISGGIDLSVAAVLPFTAIIVGLLLKTSLGVWPSIAIALGVAVLIGFINALMINKLRVFPFIATLATATMLRGVALVITEGATISGFPTAFYEIGHGRVYGIPVPVIIFLVLAVLFALLLKNHSYFQQVYFVGGNAKAAQLSGIKVNRLRYVVYGISAFMAGLAGIITASQYVSASTGFGLNSDTRVITSVIIGGASLSGGKGSIGGTIWGVIFLAIISNAFVQSGAPTYWQDVVYGGMLLAAVFLEEYLRARGRKAKMKSWREFLTSG